jgi:hypothetical protein
MANKVIAFLRTQRENGVPLAIVMQAGEMDESAAEAVDGPSPTVKALSEFEHLAIGNAAGGGMPPDPAVNRVADEARTALTIGDREEIDDADHGVEFLAEDSDDLSVELGTVEQRERSPVLAGSLSHLATERLEVAHAGLLSAPSNSAIACDAHAS